MMIIRQLYARQGLRFTAASLKPWTRCLATEITKPDSCFSETTNLWKGFIPREVEKYETPDKLQRKAREQPGGFPQHESPNPLPDAEGTSPPNKLINEAIIRKHRSLTVQKIKTGHFGSELSPHYEPARLLTDPPSPSSITLELLLASQSHLGHHASLWNPINSRYIYGIRQGIHIISLDVTAAHLRRACRVVSGVAEQGGIILFVGTRAGQDKCVVRAAELAGACHLYERWTPGSITNGSQILSRCRTKLVDEFDREITGFEEELAERPALKPDLVVCLNPLENWVMLHECAMNAVPTIGIIDTDANPTWVTYPIPANDDSLRCVQVIAGALGRAGEEGQQLRKEKAREGILTYTPANLGPRKPKPRSKDDSEDDNEDG